jgi:uncharacterized SAM-dependent methyltransferase
MPKLGFFPGSTIGNMVARTAVDLLRSMRATLGGDALLLIGMDLVKDAAVLEAAYDDAQGVTAAFNLNLARRINPRARRHDPARQAAPRRARGTTRSPDRDASRSARAIAFEVAGRRFALAKGETIHTENSHKFDRRSQYTLLLAGGWTPLERWRRRRRALLADPRRGDPPAQRAVSEWACPGRGSTMPPTRARSRACTCCCS